MEDNGKLEMLAKQHDSGNGGCPAVYIRRADGKCVVQAQAVDVDTFGGLQNVLPGEQAVWIDPDVILRAADALRRRNS